MSAATPEEGETATGAHRKVRTNLSGPNPSSTHDLGLAGVSEAEELDEGIAA